MQTELAGNRLTELAPGVRRLLAPNPGMMTGPGTNTYILGQKEIAIIDPGPLSEAHAEAICRHAPAPIKWILVTHTHPDHSPAAAALAARTGAQRLGRPAPDRPKQDKTFRPDRVLEDGDALETAEFRLEAVHTPGHASNHLCYFDRASNWLYTGDHIINGSTVVIDPPDGNMADYLKSLERLMDWVLTAIAPGHGDLIERPYDAIDWIINHRLEREAGIVKALAANPGSTPSGLVARAYRDVDKKLYPVAERSLLAHLLKLEQEGRAAVTGDRWSLVDP